jgi:type IV pilus assembly protein PilY1
MREKILWGFLVWIMPVALISADDIDVYLRDAPNGGAPYVHILLDYSEAAFKPLCIYGSTCGVLTAENICAVDVCFSQSAHDRLVAIRSPSQGTTITRFDALVVVLDRLFSAPQFAGIHVSLLVSNAGNGGTVLDAYTLLGGRYDLADPRRPMVPVGTVGAVSGADKLMATLEAMRQRGQLEITHGYAPKEAYFEWFRYLNAGTAISGTQTNGNFGFADGESIVPDFDAAALGTLGVSYKSPFEGGDNCPKLFSIVTAINPSHSLDTLDSIIAADYFEGLEIRASGGLGFADFLARLHEPDRDLVKDSLLSGRNALQKTWVIADSDNARFAKELAVAGHTGSPLDIDNPARLEASLITAFRQMLGISSTFVSSSIPVTVVKHASAHGDLFAVSIKASATQNWAGNIKKFKLRDLNTDGSFDDIIDASRPEPKQVFLEGGPNAGRISFDALSFWTDINSLPAISPTLAPYNANGSVVTRGGAGQKIPGVVADATHSIGDSNIAAAGVTSRQLFLEPARSDNGRPEPFVNFDVSAQTLAEPWLKASLGDTSMSDDIALDLIRWGRGQDTNNNRVVARPWILSDSIHSRPLIINYGAVGGYSNANPNIRLFFGSGSGAFHIVENTAKSGRESGREVFAFHPKELLGNIALRKQDTESAAKMRYGVDGPAAGFLRDKNGDGNIRADAGDEAYVYFGLRRGGRSIFALNVSDPGQAPKLQWKLSPTSGGDFDELGQTFSKPVVGKVNFSGVVTDVVIFAGGYNGGWDKTYTHRVGKDLGASPDYGIGTAIYIVNARTGELIWKAVGGNGRATARVFMHPELVDSIPSAVAPVMNPSGIIHRLYVGDSGGAVWRVDLPQMHSDQRVNRWFISKLAELGNDGVAAASDRRFFHAPDIVETFDEKGRFDGIIISSGDRARPNETIVQNYHFYLKDRLTTSGDITVRSRMPLSALDRPLPVDLPDPSLCVTGSEPECTDVFTNGWKIRLQRAGEKGLSSALVADGSVYMTTFSPSSQDGRCDPKVGSGHVYSVKLDTGRASYKTRSYDLGPGIPDGVATLGSSILLPGPGVVPDPRSGENSPPCKGKLCSIGMNTIHRLYWREPGIDDL